METENNFNLSLLLFTPSETISLDLIQSDHFVNLAIMEQLVGTLVKYGNNGVYEPFLAKSWQSSSDQLIWNFQLKENLTAENGETINANSFILSLIRNIKYLSSYLGNTALDNLIDIEKIKEGSTNQKGLIAINKSEIEFRFKTKPKGLIQFLGQPYYGYISKQDYDKNGNWLDPKKITSSGAYKIKQWNTEKSILLNKRNIEFIDAKLSPDTVLFSLVFDKSAIKERNPFTIYYNSVSVEDHLSSLKSIITTPELLLSFSLGTGKSEIFKSKDERQIFKREFSSYIQKHFQMGVNSFPVTKFYELHQSSNNSSNEVLSYNGEFTVALSESYPPKYAEIVVSAIQAILPKAKVKVVRYNKNDRKEMEKISSNENYNIRPSTVNTSSGYENWVIEMMFCTKLGISFPDPNGTVCKLVKDIHENKIPESEGAERLNKIIEDESYIIPVFREGTRVHFTDDLDIDNQSPTVAVLRFDLIRKKIKKSLTK